MSQTEKLISVMVRTRLEVQWGTSVPMMQIVILWHVWFITASNMSQLMSNQKLSRRLKEFTLTWTMMITCRRLMEVKVAGRCLIENLRTYYWEILNTAVRTLLWSLDWSLPNLTSGFLKLQIFFGEMRSLISSVFSPWHTIVPVTFEFWDLQRAIFSCHRHFFENCHGHFENITGTNVTDSCCQGHFWIFQNMCWVSKKSRAPF